MREIVLDTETTGLSPLRGDRLVEIGCVELINHLPTGKHYHAYINPERDVPAEAERVHGISTEFLADKPVFSEIAEDFLAFIATDPLIIHNADFDMGFINAELLRQGYVQIPRERAVDTVLMARKMFPGAPASLDALCKRFGVDISARTLHGALLDAQLLADVYLELRGGRQPGLEMAAALAARVDTGTVQREFVPPRHFEPSCAEREAHKKFVAEMKKPLWTQLEEDL